MNWTKESAKKAAKALSLATNMTEGLYRAQKATGGTFTWNSLDKGIRRTLNQSAFSCLSPPPVEPVAQAEYREDKASDKAQIKQLVERLREATARNTFIDTLSDGHRIPRIMKREKTSGVREMTAVVLASDWHVEEPVVAANVAYRNEYNLVIAKQRIERFFAGIIWNIEHQRASGRIAIRDLILWLGGDLITGYIHEELVESNALSPTKTCLWLLPLLRDGIVTLLEVLQLDHIEIPCSNGNHGRTTPKTRIATGAANSFEWLLYNTLAREFAAMGEKRVHFEITESPHQYVQAYDFTLHFHHGDSLKYMGGVGGLAIPLLKAVPAWDSIKYAHFHHVGHFHQLSDFGRAMVNGSLIGFGAYSQWIKAAYEPPQQMMYFLDKQRGKCLSTPLWVGESAGKVRAA